MTRRVVLSLNLDPQLAQALDAFVASRPGESRSSVARKALNEYLRRRARRTTSDEEEDDVDRALGDEALRRLNDPEEEWIPYEQARAELGL